MFCTVSGHTVSTFEDNGQVVRRISITSGVEGAYMSGENLVIRTGRGYTEIYDRHGIRIRSVRNY